MRAAAVTAVMLCCALVSFAQPASSPGPQPASSPSPQLAVSSSMDWRSGALLLDIRFTPPQAEGLKPDSRFQAERELEHLLPGLFLEAAVGVLYDSSRTVGDRIRESQDLYFELSAALSEHGGSSGKQYSRLSRDLRQLQIGYRLPMYGPGGLAAPFVLHTRPYPMPRVLGFVPTRGFSGLVIDARGQLPAHGKSTRESVRPALFPRLYDQRMNLVLSAEMCEPEYLRRWGLAAYTYQADEAAFFERIRTTPLRTAARGVFGIHSTDLILPDDAVRRLLARESNQTVLRECRILIIVDPPGPATD